VGSMGAPSPERKVGETVHDAPLESAFAAVEEEVFYFDGYQISGGRAQGFVVRRGGPASGFC
jgi:hypothetical protein